MNSRYRYALERLLNGFAKIGLMGLCFFGLPASCGGAMSVVTSENPHPALYAVCFVYLLLWLLVPVVWLAWDLGQDH